MLLSLAVYELNATRTDTDPTDTLPLPTHPSTPLPHWYPIFLLTLLKAAAWHPTAPHQLLEAANVDTASDPTLLCTITTWQTVLYMCCEGLCCLFSAFSQLFFKLQSSNQQFLHVSMTDDVQQYHSCFSSVTTVCSSHCCCGSSVATDTAQHMSCF